MTVTSAVLVPNLVLGHKSDGRCVYDKAAKRQLAQRCLQPGVSLASTAMEHGVKANVLRKWVMQESSGALGRRKRGGDRASGAALLVPVEAIAPPREQDQRSYFTESNGYTTFYILCIKSTWRRWI